MRNSYSQAVEEIISEEQALQGSMDAAQRMETWLTRLLEHGDKDPAQKPDEDAHRQGAGGAKKAARDDIKTVRESTRIHPETVLHLTGEKAIETGAVAANKLVDTGKKDAQDHAKKMVDATQKKHAQEVVQTTAEEQAFQESVQEAEKMEKLLTGLLGSVAQKTDGSAHRQGSDKAPKLKVTQIPTHMLRTQIKQVRHYINSMAEKQALKEIIGDARRMETWLTGMIDASQEQLAQKPDGNAHQQGDGKAATPIIEPTA